MPRSAGFVLALLLGAAATAGHAAEALPPVEITPTLHAVTLEMRREALQNSTSLQIALAANFATGRLVGWTEVQVLEARAADGSRLTTGQISYIFAPRERESEDDLALPLMVELSGFVLPHLRLRTLRIAATAILTSGVDQALVLPAKSAGRTFAPTDDRTATVTVTGNPHSLTLLLTGTLADRCRKVALVRADGAPEPSTSATTERTQGHELLEISPESGVLGDVHPVLTLASQVERRAVILTCSQLTLFGPDRDPELLPLGQDPADSRVPAVEITPKVPDPRP